MKFDIWTEEEAKLKCEALWDDDLVLFPSKENYAFQEFLEDFRGRQEYIKRFGFMLLNAEFVEELSKEFKQRGIENFIETGSGYGTFTKVLNDSGFSGKGYTLELFTDASEAEKSQWGLNPNPIYANGVNNGQVVLKDLKEITGDPETDLIVSSWVPLYDGSEVEAYFDNNYYPEWYLVVGEGYGGCTGSDDYHDWLEKNYEEDHVFNSYKSFAAIYDHAILYRKRT